MQKFNPVISAIIEAASPAPDYYEILGEVERKLDEGEAAKKTLYLTEKKNRVLKAENARLYETIDKIQAEKLSHEKFIENLTEYNARLLQENRAMQRHIQGSDAREFKSPVFESDCYQIRFPFNLDAFWEAINK